MRDGMFSRQLIAVLCTCAATTLLWAQEDVNAPWDPAEHLEPYWELVSFSARLYNPAENRFTDPNTQRSLSVSGAVRQLDKTGLIGVEIWPRNVLVLDQDGAEIYHTAGQFHMSRSYQATDDIRNYLGRGLWNDDIRFTVNMPMGSNQDYPSLLSRMEWSIPFLVADTFEVVEVPFAPNSTWVELTPGLEILVEEASVEEGEYTYRVRAIYDPSIVTYSTEGHWHLRAGETLPPTLMVKMEMLNVAGNPIDRVGTSGGFSSGTSTEDCDGLVIATSTGSGSCGTCGYVKTIRYTFALDPYEEKAPFVLENIPIPSF